WRCAPRHRSSSYDQRRTPYDHPDFNSNALSEDLFSGSSGEGAFVRSSRVIILAIAFSLDSRHLALNLLHEAAYVFHFASLERQ
ncbi:MAG TPA: hypothetical protein VL380_09030, partial [Nitrosospira sp.]|nr:hypothetical protein [Nitrosospira sp.]